MSDRQPRVPTNVEQQHKRPHYSRLRQVLHDDVHDRSEAQLGRFAGQQQTEREQRYT